jgi:hypothetical protein
MTDSIYNDDSCKNCGQLERWCKCGNFKPASNEPKPVPELNPMIKHWKGVHQIITQTARITPTAYTCNGAPVVITNVDEITAKIITLIGEKK